MPKKHPPPRTVTLTFGSFHFGLREVIAAAAAGVSIGIYAGIAVSQTMTNTTTQATTCTQTINMDRVQHQDPAEQLVGQ